MESHTRPVSGLQMRWEEAGTGFPVVFIHGIPTSPALWRHVVPRIGNARCLAWEMVGYGASIPQGEGRDISVARQAEYLVDWLGELGIERAILAGHDLGGGVAQIAAVRHPKLCAGLFLTNAIGYDSWPIPSVKAMQKGHALVKRMPEAFLRLTMTSLYRRGHDDPSEARAAFDVHWPHYRRNGAGRALARQVAALDVNDTLAVADALPTLSIPARLVWGTADRFQKIEYGERFARDLNAPLTRVEGGKHFTPEDHPREIAAALNDLLREVGKRANGASRSDREKGEPEIARGRADLASLPEIMPDEAGPDVEAIYEDIQAVLRVPFVNFLFRVLANDPAYLKQAWDHLRPIARTRKFEDAAADLRSLVRSAAPPRRDGTDWASLGDLGPARDFTESIDYVLPKLLLVASILSETRQADGLDIAVEPTIPLGIADGTRKIPMVDPGTAGDELRVLFDDIRDHHGHPKVATYFRSLGQEPELLKALWGKLRPRVDDADYAATRTDLVNASEMLALNLPALDFTAPESLKPALAFFRRKLIPDLMLDVHMARSILSDGAAERRNRFESTEASAGNGHEDLR
ncbi:alpha/beta fold hydrolase [uncultured Jannaschia sp.]|uniref:alpha/beta fold hydrolase n=1 Tax=uncultured Jannaschia sp. TaxID=293347 RepID=UPI002620874F|nr:alpha/beta fold hydrolase [uncultured Jannaschia sp.]